MPELKDKITLGPALKVWQDKNLEYLRYEYDLKPTDIVLDIGSYRQEWANEIRKKFACYVECFEALDDKAAGTCDGVMSIGGQYYYSSAYADDNRRDVKCMDIARYLQDDISLMKVNVEGYEYLLLNYIIDKGLASKIKNLQVQFHLIDGIDCEKSYEELASKLSVTHELTWAYPFVWENWRLKNA